MKGSPKPKFKNIQFFVVIYMVINKYNHCIDYITILHIWKYRVLIGSLKAIMFLRI